MNLWKHTRCILKLAFKSVTCKVNYGGKFEPYSCLIFWPPQLFDLTGKTNNEPEKLKVAEY